MGWKWNIERGGITNIFLTNAQVCLAVLYSTFKTGLDYVLSSIIFCR